MMFLGKEIGTIARAYKIEKEGPNVPSITLSAVRSGEYLVLAGEVVNNHAIAGSTVTDEIDINDGPEALVDGTTKKSIIKDNTEVGDCACIGFMLVKLTWTHTDLVKGPSKANPNIWETKPQEVSVSDFVVTTAYNVAREPNKNVYTVHNKSSKGGQVHVEQICGHRLRAFLEHLKGVGGARTPLFDLKEFQASGVVKFRGKANNGSPLTAACQGCQGVWKDLRKDYPFLEGITLSQD